MARALGIVGLPGVVFALLAAPVVLGSGGSRDPMGYFAVIAVGAVCSLVALLLPVSILRRVGSTPIAAAWVAYPTLFILVSGGRDSPFLTGFIGSVMVAAVVSRPVVALQMALMWVVGFIVIGGADATQTASAVLQLAVNCSMLGVMAIAVSELATRRRIQTRRFMRRLARIGERAARDHAESLMDPLTGLGNRRRFDEDLARALARLAGHPGSAARFALVMADADHLKTVNDAHGHPAGDAMLQAIALGLVSAVRAGDHVYRIGGDEFAAIVPAASAPALRDRIGDRVAVDVKGLGTVTAAIGVAEARKGDSAALLYRRADQALLEVKRERRTPLSVPA
jgi:diguanylate cyclase (GGDEF)-like protein